MTKPQVFDSVAAFRAACDQIRASGGTLGLVPTMGALHEGHLALMREARKYATHVAATIFVNPTQFGPNEDFAHYPRTFEKDLELCATENVNLVFAPPTTEMYPAGERTRVRVEGLTEALCGPKRPGHFEGVATIVTKLFNAAGPCTAVFGRKDYQQLKVIERMTRDLLLPIRIVGYPTVREASGLALSSRNAYLSDAERELALTIPKALSRAVQAFENGERRTGALRNPVEQALAQANFRIDYVTVAEADALTPYDDDANLPDRAVLALAAFCGKTRLIDNVVLGEDKAPIAPPPQ